MSKPIRRVAVLGAGVMGSGIAAHVTNAGLPVLLLDIVPPNLSDEERKSKKNRNRFADSAVKKMLKTKPAPFFHKRNAQLVTTGNFDDDLESLKDYDLIIEAIIERLDIKQSLFSKLENIVSDTTIVASNTSGLRIKDMLEGRTDTFKNNFMVTHFFNPPRYMKLLELVAGPDTSSASMERAATFGKEALGKGIVVAKDSPNFVANRIGAHSMMAVIQLMDKHGLSPEDVDAISGIPMGHPKSATFRTADMVGLDTLAHVVKNCYEMLTDDEDRDVFTIPPFVTAMIEKKQLGNKTRGGFYRKGKGGIETLDPSTGEYRARGGDQDIRKLTKKISKEADAGERLRQVVAAEGVVGQFAWDAISKTLAYSIRRMGEITDSIVAIDNGMKWGYNWDLGPFETWDALGFKKTLERMEADGVDLPVTVKKMRDAGVESFYDGDKVYDVLNGKWSTQEKDPRELSLPAIRVGESPVMKTNSAEAWDWGDGVLGITFTSKANSIDPEVIKMLTEGVARAEKDFRAVVVANEGDHFCVGANLFLILMGAQQKNWEQIRGIIESYQGAVQRMRYASVPIVAAPYGMTLGGGLELCFGCDAVQAASETYSGLVEVGVGVIPGGAGTMNMLWRSLEGIPDGVEYDISAFVTQVFKNIAMAEVATSAGAGIAKGYFRQSDGISFDRARQLSEAKARALGLATAGYHPPLQRAYKLPGASGIATLKMMVNTLVAGGFATEHDAHIAGRLATVLCGGVGGATHLVTESEILELECEAFLSLCGEQKSQDRMQHMLMKNKPLRN